MLFQLFAAFAVTAIAAAQFDANGRVDTPNIRVNAPGRDSGSLGANLGINMGRGGQLSNAGIPVWGGRMDVDYGAQGKGIVGTILGSGIEKAIRTPISAVDSVVKPLEIIPTVNLVRGTLAAASRIVG